MRKFEYTLKNPPFSLDLDQLNELGQEGWELVSVNDHCSYIFKRELREYTCTIINPGHIKIHHNLNIPYGGKIKIIGSEEMRVEPCYEDILNSVYVTTYVENTKITITQKESE